MPRVEAHPALRSAAINTWRGRMVNEHGSARVFEGLAAQLAGLGWDEAAATCRTFADEERRHGAMCGAVVEAMGGEAVADVLPAPPFPQHPDVGPIEATTRNVLSIACLAETVAVALIGAEREEMPEGELRELLTRIWADECGHARFGWLLLPRLLEAGDPGLRERLVRYLEVAFGHLEAHELAHLPLEARGAAPEAAALGLCSGSDARALLYDAIAQVIVPALEAQGLRAGDAWASRRPAA